MKIFLDSSDVDEIREAVDTGLIDGVTTNPTLMLRSGRDLMDVLAAVSYTHLTLPTIYSV